MAKFSFRKAKTEEESDLPESVEGDEAAVELEDPEEEGGGRSRRLLLILGLVVILAGGGYLAWNLFLEQPPPLPLPPRPIAAPMAKAPAPAAPQASAVPAPMASAPAPAKQEAKAVSPAPAKPEAKPASPPTATAEAKPTAPGKTATVAGKPAPAPPAKTEAKADRKPVAGPSSFSLQVGAMVMQENAETLKRRLDERGFPASVRKGTAYITKHVVTVGEFGGRREAEELARRLSVDGFTSQLLAEEGKYAPQVASFFNLDEAIDLARELQKKGHIPKISSKPANTTVFQVRHGTFDSRASAVKRGDELRAKGFNVLIVQN